MTPTDPPRCEPPPELRGVDGWHWVKAGDNPSECWRWSENGRYWQSTSAFSVRQASSYGYRYVAPVTPPAVVAERPGPPKGTRHMTDWQPIETAPKDGTEVLLWCSPHSESELDSIFVAAWVTDAGYDHRPYSTWIVPQADDKEGGWADTLRWTPTHWMPLPAPPQSTS